MNRWPIHRSAWPLLAVILMAAPLRAALSVWDGGGANSNWNTVANWAGDLLPPIANDVEFGSGFASGTTIETNGNRTANSILINTSTNFAISGDTFGLTALTLSSGNITRSGGTGTVTIDSPLILGQNGTWNPGSTTTSNINVTGAIGQSGAGRSLTKTGLGTLTLSGGGSYSGGTFVNEFTLRMANTTPATGAITVATDATLEVSNLTTSTPININGTGYISGLIQTGALRSVGASTINGPVNLQSSAMILSSSPLTINGVISDGTGSFQLTADGFSELRLNAANTYDGGTRVFGHLIAAHPQALGSGLVTLINGELEVAENININRALRLTNTGILTGSAGADWSGPVEVANTNENSIKSAADFSISGNISNTAGITGGKLKTTGPGRVILTGNNVWNIFNVPAGTLSLRSSGAAGGRILADGGEVEIFGPITVTPSIEVHGLGPGGQGALRVMSGASTSVPGISLLDDAAIFVASAAQLTVLGNVTGSQSGLTKTGAGTLVLAGTGQYPGATFVQTGTLSVAGDSNLGPGPINVSGTLLFNSTTTTSRNISLNGGRLAAASGAMVTINGSTISGGFLGGPGNFASQADAVLNGVTALAGSSLTPAGSTFLNSYLNGGDLTCAVPLTWNGGINLSSGKVTINSNTLSTTAFTNDGVITINNAATLLNDGNTLTSGGGSRITINTGGTLNVSANSLHLNGALLWNNGTINGPTNVNFGSLAKGAGVYGSVNVTDGGRFSPGNSPGTVTTGSTKWNSGGSYLVEIGDALRNDQRDFWIVDGILSIDASTRPFVISLASIDGLLFDNSRDYSWPILHADGGIAGFDPAKLVLDTSGFKNSLGFGHFSLESTSNDLLVHFSSVPEPSHLAALFAGFCLTAFRRRRNRESEPGRNP